MSSDNVLHCGKQMFASYNHCPECGDALKHKPVAKSAISLKSDVLDPLKKNYKSAKTFTGKVLKTYIYTRSKTVKNNDGGYDTNEHPYCFLTLENEKGEVLEINVTAEGTTANEISVGDAVTILDTMPLSIPLNAPNGIKHLMNDDLADAFIVHCKNGDRFSRQDMSGAFTLKEVSFGEGAITTIVTTILLSLAMYAALLFYPHPDEAIVAVPCIAFVIGLFARQRLYSKAAKLKAQVEVYSAVVDELRSIRFDELGYQFSAPNKAEDDVFCGNCDERISKSVHFCTACGQKNNTNVHVAMQAAHDSTDVKPDNMQGSVINHTSSTQSASPIKDKRLSLMNKYKTAVPEAEFKYRKWLGLTETFTCSADARVLRVLDRSFYANKKTTESHHTTTTSYYSGNTGAHIRDEVSVETSRRTNVDLEGQVLVENCDGDIYEIEVHSEILGTLDVNDYLFVGYQNIEKGKNDASRYRMVQRNLTKGIRVYPYDIQDYSSSSIMENLFPYVAIAGGIYAGINFDIFYHYLYPYITQYTDYFIPRKPFELGYWGFGFASFAVICFVLSRFVSRVEKLNRKASSPLVKPVYDSENAAIDDKVAVELAKYV